MRLLRIFAALSTLLWATQATHDGLTEAVEWDGYSLMVNGSRVFVFAGEFHYQRMPVPELWLDIFQKFKANGFNAVSIYFFWSYHSPAKDVYDFETSGKNVQLVLDYAKQAGLWVIARPGPYCNAESTGGGYPLWGSDGSLGSLRTSDATYAAAWAPWVAKIGKIIADNQITNGGPIIMSQVENELTESSHVATNTLVVYMKQLETAFRAAGVTVPFSHNEKGMRGESWSVDYQNVGGAVNLYGLDSYPGGTSCTNSNSGYNLLRTYFQWFANYAFSQPSFFPEFEGGWFSGWGATTFYDDCTSDHDPAFSDLYYKNNIAQRVTLQSLYMAWGGTNWGHSAAPVVYTSYDYSAPLRETRQIQTKFYHIKLIGLFTRVSTDLLKTYMVGNGTGYASSSTGIFTWELRNPDTNAGFYTTQQATSSSRTSVTFTANLSTSDGYVLVPNVNLNGRQSKILVTDYTFGNHTLSYCSSDVLTYGVFGSVDVIALYLQSTQVGQFAIKNVPTNSTYQVYGSSSVTANQSGTTLTFVYTQAIGQTVIQIDNVLIYLLERETAWKFWAPATTSNPEVKPNEQIFVLGPYLVRDASTANEMVEVVGDSDNATTIEVFTGKSKNRKISWNGKELATTKTAYGSLRATIDGAADRVIVLPALTSWRSADSLPEKLASYNDSNWIICNKTTTSSPVAPYTKPVLFASDYGFYTGAKVYRGYFDGKTFKSVNITASGGLAFGWSAWLNGVLIGGDTGASLLTTTTAVLTFSNITLKDTDNLITVVVDYHGHDETSTAKGLHNPRGILGASLTSTNLTSSASFFKTWKIQGNAGGSSNLDPVRGPLNEGGLYGERLGWPLPNFSPDSKVFDHASPITGFNTSGIRMYLTTFDLKIDSDLDVPLGISFSAPAGTVARIMLWVNGYQYGKYVPHVGPQTVFPVPPGVINNHGRNWLAVSLWAMTDAGAKLDEVTLVKYGVYESSFGFNRDWDYLQTGWGKERLAYA